MKYVSSVKFMEHDHQTYIICCGENKKIEIFKYDNINCKPRYINDITQRFPANQDNQTANGHI